MKRKPGETGTLPRNLHEGSRSESLARFFFQAFGPAFQVPREEDFGIDLYGALGEPKGQRLHVEDYYLVQVKSDREPIVYNGKESVSWLLCHRYPFLVCHVDKRSSTIEVFHTLALTSIVDPSRLITLTLVFDESSVARKNDDSHAEMCLGRPIVRVRFDDIEGENRGTIRATLRSWIRLLQWNITSKQFGGSVFNIPATWETNEPVEALSLKGNAKEAIQNPVFQDSFFQMLSQLLFATLPEDKEGFRAIAGLAEHLLQSGTVKDSWGFRALAIAFNTTAEYFGEEDRLYVTLPDGSFGPLSKIARG